jgi:hypothetical protein
MIRKLLRKLGLGRKAAEIVDTVAVGVADQATGGKVSKLERKVKRARG